MNDFIWLIEIKHVTNIEWESGGMRGKAIHSMFRLKFVWYTNFNK